MSVFEQEPVLFVNQESLLGDILLRLQGAANLAAVLDAVSPKIVELLNAERVTIYRRDKQSGEMVSRVNVADRQQEIRLSSSTTSIAGYCALSRQVINVEDVYDAGVLTKIHPKLVFQGFFDRAFGFRTRAILATPILFNGALLGVLQIINRRGGGRFTDAETTMVTTLARALGEKVRQELQSTIGPFAYLVQTARISQEDLDRLQERSANEKQPVSRLLARELQLDAAVIGESLARFYQIPFMPYDPAIVIPDMLLQGINPSYLRTCGWLPLAGDRNEVTILIDDPSDGAKLQDVQRLMNAQVYHFRLGLPDDIPRYLGPDTAAQPPDGAAMGEGAEAADSTAQALVERLLSTAVEQGASHVHIEPMAGKQASRVRLRIAASFLAQEGFSGQFHEAVVSRIKDLAGLDTSRQDHPQSGKLSFFHTDHLLEFGVTVVPTLHGEAMVLRPMASGATAIPLGDLHLAPHNQRMLQQALAQSSGLFLVVGPEDSGKTTTLHALLQQWNTAESSIWTVESPIEIAQPGLQQVAVTPGEGPGFAEVLRTILHCDPDVVMVGDLGGREVCDLALEAALAGRMVLSSLRCGSASEALVRLREMGLDNGNLTEALLGVMALRRLRRLCRVCRQPVELSAEIQGRLASLYGERFDEDCGPYLTKGGSLFRRGACKACQGSGFQGSIAVQEVLVVTPELKETLSRAAPLAQIRAAAVAAGMRTLIQDRIVKTLQGHLDVEDVRGGM